MQYMETSSSNWSIFPVCGLPPDIFSRKLLKQYSSGKVWCFNPQDSFKEDVFRVNQVECEYLPVMWCHLSGSSGSFPPATPISHGSVTS